MKWGHGPGHWQGMVCTVILEERESNRQTDEKRNIEVQTDKQTDRTPDPGGWMDGWMETKAGLRDCLAQSKRSNLVG